ncbi:MAG: hypothetical protein WAV93_11325 [Bacteroidales bacterium]
MKKLICTSVFAVLAAVATVSAQNEPEEYLGLPGDNLNLYAVMNLFQESETLEAFERDLNAENSRINNLDLNGDNMVDYITVSDYVDRDVHTIVLRTALSRNEQQDIAVFTVEKLRNGAVQIQLIGDEALYGRNYIVEPIYAETPNPGYKGRTVYRDNVTVVTTTYYEVAAWPVIRFIYNPYYVSWRSAWYWGYYPVYWNPWRPYYWHYYYGYHSNWYPHYYSHYRHWHQPRWYGYHDHYYNSVRAYSPSVSKRITEGHYRQTYSRPETRRDGEALYASSRGTRSNPARPAAVSDSDRRSSAATSGSSGRAAEATGSDRRSPAAAGSRTEGSQYGGQNGQARRSTSDAVKSAPASGTRSSSSTEATRQSTTTRSQAPQSSAQRSQSTYSRSQAPVQRSESSAQRSQPTYSRSQAPAQRSQSSAQRSQSPASRSQSTVQKSSPSASRGSSAPAARSQGSSRTSEGRSSSAPSRSSSNSSKNSDSNSRSSRR